MLFVLILALCVVLALFCLLAPRVVPWAEGLTRLNAGAGPKAEWMAPPQVVEQVVWDYGNAQEWFKMCAGNWGRFARGLDRYTTGAYLKLQRRLLAALVASPPRLALRQSAAHEISVRHFSADGLRCLLVDRQTSRVLTTSNYWSGRVLHRQRIPETTLVYQMLYDLHERRWKIERLIQELPFSPHANPASSNKPRVSLVAELPAAMGRDS